MKITLTDAESRIKAAIETALNYGPTDGAHHKMWVISQMLSQLMGKEEFLGFLKICKENGNDWDEGIAP